MKIILANQVDVQQWDQLAAALGGGYFHCHAHAVADATLRDADPLFVKAIDHADRCIGLTTGRLDTPVGWPFSRHCRSATLFALPVMRNTSLEAQRAFMETLEAQLRAQGVFLVNITSHDSPNAQQILSLLCYGLEPRTEFYIDLKRSETEIWSCLKGKKRTHIRKAEKHGVQTRIENTEEAFNLAYSFFDKSMQRRQTDFIKAGERTRRARRERFKSGHLDVFISYKNATPVNGGIFSNFNGRPYYVFGGALPEGLSLSGPSHMIWTAITTYRERGAIYLNLGAASADQTIYRFKQEFGAAEVSQPLAKKTLSGFGARLNRLRVLLRRKTS